MTDNELRSGDRFSVLFVCTANLCRSPMAENMFRAMLDRVGLDWTTASAGVRARDGAPMQEHSAAVLDERGIGHEGWVSTRLSPASIRSADLVLTAEGLHRQSVVRLHPAAVRYSFTLLQFAGLLSLVGPDAHREQVNGRQAGLGLIRRAELARARPQSRYAHSMDLADPMGQSIDGFRATADHIEKVLAIVEANVGSTSFDASVS